MLDRATGSPAFTSAFAHWEPYDPMIFGVASDRQDIVVTPNGHHGADGPEGADGTSTTAPADGGAGTEGTASQNAIADGTNLVFQHHHPHDPFWEVSATTGRGGSGGNGGHGGDAFPTSPGPGGRGGDGGAAGVSGNATASIDGRTIFGDTGDGANFGIAIAVSALSGRGGDGGSGGFGGSGPMTGGNGGTGMDGGVAGSADAGIDNSLFRVNLQTGAPDVHIDLTLGADAGRGGNGGDGGPGAPGSGGFAADGANGDGGQGGDAEVTVSDCTIRLGTQAGATSTLTLIMAAHGGDGGNGGAHVSFSGFPSGNGGQGGAGSVHFLSTHVDGGAEDDVVQLALNASGGIGGINVSGVQADDGAAVFDVSGVVLAGGGGDNTLAFSFSGNATTAAVNVNLDAQTFFVAAGPINTILEFQNVTGGSGADTLTGDGGANTLRGMLGGDVIFGGAGDDRITGGSGTDALAGGAGNDTFVYAAVSDSTGVDCDGISDMDFARDLVYLAFAVNGIGAFAKHAAINSETFDDDMAHAANAHHLGAQEATLVTVTSGSLFGHTFLVIDANGQAGYQGGEDLVIDVTGATHSSHLTVDTFI